MFYRPTQVSGHSSGQFLFWATQAEAAKILYRSCHRSMPLPQTASEPEIWPWVITHLDDSQQDVGQKYEMEETKRRTFQNLMMIR